METKIFIVGRNPKASAGETTISVDDPTNRVSKNHCRISFDGQNLFIEDLNSTNGTYVNGNKITGKTGIDYSSALSLGRNFPFNLETLNINPSERAAVPNESDEIESPEDYKNDINSSQELEKNLLIENKNSPPSKILDPKGVKPKSESFIAPVVPKKEKKKMSPLIIVVVLLILMLLGGGGYYFANGYNPETVDESSALLQNAENHYNSGEYREAFEIYNKVLSQFPEDRIARQRVDQLISENDLFQERSVDSVMRLYLQTASLEDFNPKDSILGYKITTGFHHIFGVLDTLKNDQKIISEPTVLNKALNNLEISHHYFTASSLYAAGEGMEALSHLEMASQIGSNPHVENLKNLIANTIEVPGVIEEKPKIVFKSGVVNFTNTQIPPIFIGCPYNMNASELRECFNDKFKDFMDARINPKDYTHLPIKHGIQNINVSFVVGKDGNIKDIQVVAPHQKIENDVYFAVQNLKGIKPGFRNHVPVEVGYKNNYSFEVLTSNKLSREPLKESVVARNSREDNISIGNKSISMAMADHAPIFPGCEDQNKKMLVNCSTENIDHFITEYIDYRSLAQAGIPPGPQSFFVKFQINEQGGVQNIEVKTPLEDVKREVIKVVKLMPRMGPGIYKSRTAIVDYSTSLTIEVE